MLKNLFKVSKKSLGFLCGFPLQACQRKTWDLISTGFQGVNELFKATYILGRILTVLFYIFQKHALMERVAHQTICMQFLLELARTLETDPRSTVKPFFNKYVNFAIHITCALHIFTLL